MRLKASTWVMFGICGFMLVLNLLARCSMAFSDFYVTSIFPHISAIWVRFSGLFPFSIGEMLICLAVIVGVPALIAFPFLMLFAKVNRGRIACIYGKCIGWIMTWLFIVLTLHFFILYQCTPFGDKYYPDAPDVYTAEEITPVLEEIIARANETALLVARDENGNFILTDDLQSEAKEAMRRLGERYPQYAGFYPNAKPIHFSYVMSHQNILGIYYPFTMEANYNRDICPINLPNTVCHEFTHLKGNIFEDEAGFLAFLACVESDSADFRYSGYIQGLEYLLDVAWDIDPEGGIANQLSPLVWEDLYEFVPDGYWQEEEHQLPDVLPEEVVEEVSSTLLDTNLKLNGIEDGDLSYGRMVDLILDYYIQEQ